jgi:hypothetical protein
MWAFCFFVADCRRAALLSGHGRTYGAHDSACDLSSERSAQRSASVGQRPCASAGSSPVQLALCVAVCRCVSLFAVLVCINRLIGVGEGSAPAAVLLHPVHIAGCVSACAKAGVPSGSGRTCSGVLSTRLFDVLLSCRCKPPIH